ncbi:MAG: M42 family metallopeptidase [Candidatus Bipolaricaulota bacterium]|nr:M42 family metallopeptidase [Candidatus Bipolaricaulota bacterium]MDW8140956.1 M42 family metallopeptidase [Candidatus Bipolaricaulota bacterium]
METRSLEFLKRLLATISPSGYEDEAAHVWAAEAKTFADEVRTDTQGNVIAVVHKGGKPRVMLAGHMDEIGFMITHIDDQGFLYFGQIGGWDPQIAQGQRVWIRTATGRVLGVIGKKPIHLLKEEERTKVTKTDELWIDIGAKDRAEAEKLVRIGDPVVVDYGFAELRNGLVVSRGFDDKAGAFTVLEAGRLLAKLNPKAEIHIVATVQEEVGLRGAHTSAFGIDPLVGIAVDVGFATDFPTMADEQKRLGIAKVGQGPLIARGPTYNHKVVQLLLETAQAHKIPYQMHAEPRGTGTDAYAMQMTRAGIAAGLVSIPNRYMHSPCEIVSLADLENAYTLIAHTVAQIDEKMSFARH